MIALVHETLDRVGDLQLAAPRRLDGVDGLKDIVIEHVDADQRQIARRLLGFSTSRTMRPFVQFGHAIVLRLGHARQHDLAVPVAGGKLAQERRDPALDDVVAQEHDKAIVAEKVARS